MNYFINYLSIKSILINRTKKGQKHGQFSTLYKIIQLVEWLMKLTTQSMGLGFNSRKGQAYM